MKDTEDSQPIVKSIVKAANILIYLQQNELNITELSDKLGMSKGTVHRLVKTLESTGLVMKYLDTKRYCLGPLITRFASGNIAHQRLIHCAYEEMNRLNVVTGETVILEARVATEQVVLHEVLSKNHIRFWMGVGFVFPKYHGAGGKVILSELAEDELRFELDKITYKPSCAHPFTSKDNLIAEIQRIKKQGYASSYNERNTGAAAVAMPIKNYACPVALAVAGPADRFKAKMLDFLPEIKASVERISRNLERF